MKLPWPELTVGNAPTAVLLRDEYYPFGARLDMLYLSDFHFTGRSRARAAALLAQVQALRPGLILLGGDYADTRAGLLPLAHFARGAARVAPVLAVAGNHDVFLGTTLVRQTLQAAGAQWLEGRCARFRLDAAHAVHIAGNYSAPEPGGLQPGLLRVLCAHYPPAGPALPPAYDLILAGHLHGGQVVGWQRQGHLFPGRWLARWNVLRDMQGSATVVVSRGLGDTLPIRYNCPREIVRIRLGPEPAS
ncbi:metallophosphoesterase [Hymenobacter sp. DH14]|uniref:Metallophosphoesterase n=1 Tax=Hymenobacter cyanobacteriorum TaxID=2926463 RepID=A0A9X2AGQ0_9BACT|nr:metallophosphoesterase [Hymenobacter cyanobacteriorum]MCI1186565.1 metallophosphoesterase [Hymenobacter cyanobacteriorum]